MKNTYFATTNHDFLQEEQILHLTNIYIVFSVWVEPQIRLLTAACYFYYRISVCMECKAIIAGFRFMETNFPEESYTLPSDPPYMKGIEAVFFNKVNL